MDNLNNIKLVESDSVPSEAKLPTSFGDFNIRVFHEESTGFDHVALTLGEMGPQLQAALRAIQERGWGCLLYLRQEGRGIGLHAKIQAYRLQDLGADTLDANLMLGHPADGRDYKIAALMLDSLKIESVSLLTNNPNKIEQLQSYGINVVERVPLIVGVGDSNRSYLETKAERMGHSIDSNQLE